MYIFDNQSIIDLLETGMNGNRRIYLKLLITIILIIMTVVVHRIVLGGL